jgi:hypothetical protein
VHAGGTVASSQSTASWVADLRDGVQHWATATSGPCTSIFKPVAVDEPVDLGPFPGDTVDASLWWRHEHLHRRAVTNPEALFQRFTPERDRTELAWLADPPTSVEAFAEADDLLDRWTRLVTFDPVPDVRPVWARRYWAKRNERAGLTTASAAA